nr:copper amine oxidase N-terminal domain-containing protein [Paenibacillus monticola]
MFQQFEQHSNARLYDFQSEAQWTFNLDLYKDISHHNEQVNSWIAEAIGRDDSTYRVSADNIEPLNNTLISQTTSATIDKLGNVYAYDIRIKDKSFPLTSRVIQGDGELFVTATEAALALEATLTWDSISKTAILANKQQKLEMTVGNNIAKVNGKEVPMTNPLLLTAGRTMLPLQFVADQLGWKTTVHIAGAAYLLTIDSP